MSKGPCSHKETWGWNEEAAEAVREKKKSLEIAKKEKSTEAWKEYKRVDKMQRGSFPWQRERNRRNVQAI